MFDAARERVLNFAWVALRGLRFRSMCSDTRSLPGNSHSSLAPVPITVPGPCGSDKSDIML